MDHCGDPWSKLPAKPHLEEMAFLPVHHQMPLCGHSLPRRALPVATAAATWDNHGGWKPKTLPSLAPPVPHAGCIFRSLSALVKTEGISPSRFAFSVSPVSLERSQTETSPRRVWNGSAGQLGMPVRQPALLPPFSLAFFEVCSSSAFLLLLPPSPHSPYHTSSTQTFPGHFT